MRIVERTNLPHLIAHQFSSLRPAHCLVRVLQLSNDFKKLFVLKNKKFENFSIANSILP